MAFEPWYVEVLDGDRGSVLGTVNLTLFTVTKTVNEKESLDFTCTKNTLIQHDRWIYLKHGRTGNKWFYGQIDSIDHDYTSGNGRTSRVKAFCNLGKLSEIAVGELGLFDFGWTEADTALVIDNTYANEEDFLNEEVALPYTWNIRTGIGHNTGESFGLCGFYTGSRTPFSAIRYTLSNGVTTAQVNDAEFKTQYLNNESGWRDIDVSDTSNELQNSGEITENQNFQAVAGEWKKNSQEGFYRFWWRNWFRLSTGRYLDSITITALEVYKRLPTPTAIDKLMALLTGWTITDNTTTDDVYLEMRGGETAVEALRLLSSMTGGWFANGSRDSDSILWSPTSDELKLPQNQTIYTVTDDLSGPISGLGFKYDRLTAKELKPVATRVKVYGAGNGQRRLTPNLENISTGFPVGFTYSQSANLLTAIDAESQLGRKIEREVNIPYIASLYTSGASVEASNQLLSTALRWLQKASRTDRKAWSVSIAEVTQPIDVGDTVRLIYTDTEESIDELFLVTKADFVLSNGSFRVNLELTDDGWLIDTETNQIHDQNVQTKHRTTYTQPIHMVNVEEAPDEEEEDFIILPPEPRDFEGAICVPGKIFLDPFNPTTTEFTLWVVDHDLGEGALYRYTIPGTGDINNPDRVWLYVNGIVTEVV